MGLPTPDFPRFDEPVPELVSARVGMYAHWPLDERRKGGDRRDGPTKMISRWNLFGARARGRRRGEDKNIYVDRYQTSDLIMVMSILILNILDAWLTLVYLGYGGTEANPVAKALLEAGTSPFVGAKSLAVGVCLLFLVLHKKFRVVRPALRVIVGFYGTLAIYHVYLQATALLSGNIV